ncbi:hypothetical protein A2U01_0017595 [Trifolium medium]|uniref:Uncharacterized protein n=1 Tax=Trifolium medium TaxID=97028 RepID=A0A392NC34_9FABA|nr:hypothetical protein [Trifolium medium]
MSVPSWSLLLLSGGRRFAGLVAVGTVVVADMVVVVADLQIWWWPVPSWSLLLLSGGRRSSGGGCRYADVVVVWWKGGKGKDIG